MGTSVYIQYLCAVGYNNSAISQLVEQPTICPNTKAAILDVNLPSITIPNLRKSTTITRKVTNVGPQDSMYKAMIEAPLGISVTARPNIMASSSTKTITFTVELSTTHQVNSGCYFGRLAWVDGVHTVSIPISVRTRLIQSYVNDN